MKRLIFNVLAIAFLSVVFFASCKKDYHCQCSYNNGVMLIKDLGSQSKSNAESQCSGYDTTVTGEKWDCTIY